MTATPTGRRGIQGATERLTQVTEGLWTAEAPLTYWGLRVNTRMTVCRLTDGGLALVAPVPVSAALRSAVDALGPVRAIIAPNLMHHLFVGEWTAAYPEARGFIPPGLLAKRPDLEALETLGEGFDEALGAELQRYPIAGAPKLGENLFFHHASATLIATDLCFFMPQATGLTGLFAWVTGIDKAPRCEVSVRVLIRDRRAFRASLRPLRALSVEHLSMCHHQVLSTGATEALGRVLDELKVVDDGG